MDKQLSLTGPVQIWEVPTKTIACHKCVAGRPGEQRCNTSVGRSIPNPSGKRLSAKLGSIALARSHGTREDFSNVECRGFHTTSALIETTLRNPQTI